MLELILLGLAIIIVVNLLIYREAKRANHLTQQATAQRLTVTEKPVKTT
jgi:hypothetical protein